MSGADTPLRPWWAPSTTSTVLVVAYLALAVVAFHHARTCTGWVCDLGALPAALPLGLPIAWLFEWADLRIVLPSGVAPVTFRTWSFIVPTVVANVVFYHGIGRLLDAAARRIRARGRRR